MHLYRVAADDTGQLSTLGGGAVRRSSRPKHFGGGALGLSRRFDHLAAGSFRPSRQLEHFFGGGARRPITGSVTGTVTVTVSGSVTATGKRDRKRLPQFAFLLLEHTFAEVPAPIHRAGFCNLHF
ncbi:hypothetical protein FIV42_28505 [Persicimonas caeni]|uniref:Uncharacterized protein n=1 Tax=Persicimonas caeni TaxID=2292766 RepID=A0A4Y6Q1T2_PERCE|nr:hypothetical protein [Persicimonas caeni]QDG54544.1 hypothetical protein FIV42_28505 [Persicimonas caeni]QED35765.1 hypothetical protein FRD00_28500 [Persicimonas caeni]